MNTLEAIERMCPACGCTDIWHTRRIFKGPEDSEAGNYCRGCGTWFFDNGNIMREGPGKRYMDNLRRLRRLTEVTK